MKSSFILLLVTCTLLLVAPAAFAHVVVKPSEVGIGAFQTFTVGVPNEKEIPVTEIRLIIPKGLNNITPNVKPGWNIEIKKTGESMKGEILNTGEKAPDPETVTEVIWSGGSIPAGQRDEFLFSAQTPSSPTDLNWLAYQTYSDGTVVSWDKEASHGHNENEAEDDPNSGPASHTSVVDDLKTSDSGHSEAGEKEFDGTPVILSILALALAGTSLFMQIRKK